MLTRVLASMKGLLRRDAIDAEVDEELRFHIEMETQANIQRGMAPGEAKRIAIRDLGGITQTHESVRGVRTLWVESLWQDVRHVARLLVRRPGFAIVSVVTIALAIGANTAILSVADAVLFRPLPYADPDRICILQMWHRQTAKQFTLVGQSYLDAINGSRQATSEVALLGPGEGPVVDGPDGAERISGVAVTPNYYQLLGVRPARGRIFEQRDLVQAGRPAMLSYRIWRERFAGDESIIGRTVKLGSTTFDVIGILPSDFVYPSVFVRKGDLVTLMAPPKPGDPGGAFNPVVRLRPGVTRAQAQAQIDGLVWEAAKIDREMQDATPLLQDVRTVLYPTGRPIMRFLLSAAILVLLVGCVNLATMLLARSRRRERDIAIRIALGAPRVRLVRPLIIESLLLSMAGSLLALGVTWWTFDALLRHVPALAYGGAPVGVSSRVMLFALALGGTAGLGFGVVPAWRAARLDAQALMQGGFSRGRQSAHGGLVMVAAQVALAIVLVFGGIVASRAFLSVLRVPLNFQPDGVVTVAVPPPRGAKAPLAAQDFYVRAVESIRGRADVLSVGAAGALPLDGSAPNEGVGVRGGRPVAGIVHVLPGYFETAGIRLVRGRLLRWDDVRNVSNAALVSQAAARALFPGRDPVGATFSSTGGRLFTVVGIVSDVKSSFDSGYDSPRAYTIGGEQTRRMTLVVRTHGRSEAILTGIKRDIARLVPGIPVEVGWWSDDISAITAYRNPRFETIVLVSFALLALVLTAIGTFATISMLVATRLREMGVRMAMGATPGSLVRLIVVQAAAPVGVGLVVGLLSTRWLARLAQAQLFAVDTHDPVMLATTAVTVVAGALIAAWLPARRAGKVDPVVVLRTE